MVPDRWTDKAWKVAAWVAAHALVAFGATQLIGRWTLGDWFQTSAALRFDAVHYAAIARDGYVPFRQAFFPSLPIVWRATNLDIGGICLFNGIVYLLTTTWITCKLRINLKTLLLFLTLPSTIFFFVPYTESLFFAFSSVIIIGMIDRSVWMILLGLFLCSVTRPTFTTLLPAVILAIGISNPSKMARVSLVTLCVLACALGLTLVSAIQHAYTGDWFGFYTAQQGWGNKLRWPSLPLGSWGGDDVVRLDAVALLFGLSSFCMLLRDLTTWIKNPEIPRSPTLVLSIGSLAFVSALVFVLRGGQLFSLNRFIFCTPFFLVLVSHLTERKTTGGWKPLIVLLFSLQVYFTMFGSMVHIQNFLKFSLVVGYLLFAVAATSGRLKVQKWAYPVLLIIAFGIQVSLAVKFLSGGWVA